MLSVQDDVNIHQSTAEKWTKSTLFQCHASQIRDFAHRWEKIMSFDPSFLPVLKSRGYQRHSKVVRFAFLSSGVHSLFG